MFDRILYKPLDLCVDLTAKDSWFCYQPIIFFQKFVFFQQRDNYIWSFLAETFGRIGKKIFCENIVWDFYNRSIINYQMKNCKSRVYTSYRVSYISC